MHPHTLVDQIYSMIVQVFLGAKLSNYKTLGKLSVLKMAIEEQDFSSVLEQAEQHGCEIDECSFFRFGLVQKIDKKWNIHRPLALVV